MQLAFAVATLAWLVQITAEDQRRLNKEVLGSLLGRNVFQAFPTTAYAREIAGQNVVMDFDRDAYAKLKSAIQSRTRIIQDGSIAEDFTPYWETGYIAALSGREELPIVALDSHRAPPGERQYIDASGKGRNNLVGYLWYLDTFVYPKIDLLAGEGRFFKAYQLSSAAAKGMSHFHIRTSEIDPITRGQGNIPYVLLALLSEPAQAYLMPGPTKNYIAAIHKTLCPDPYQCSRAEHEIRDEPGDDSLMNIGSPKAPAPCVIGKLSPVVDLALNFSGCRPQIEKWIALEGRTPEQSDILALLKVRALYWNAWHCTVGCNDEIGAFRAFSQKTSERKWLFRNFAREIEFYQSEGRARWR